ncbi:MAG: hypothetical protein IE937_01665 [Gammaproteobacteria bacterium]|nr:hypothetical protein [Gammaproteobacteria bacterium]MBD3775691.1 hypothetical protein [Thiotrichales bacterium]
MQTTSFKKGFLGIIGSAVLLSSSAIWAQDEPRYPKDRMEAHQTAPDRNSDVRDEKRHDKPSDNRHEQHAKHDDRAHHPSPYLHAQYDRGYASFRPVYVTEYVEYVAPKHRAPRWENQLLFMVKSLGLSPRQEIELRLIFKDSHAERKALRHQKMERIRALLTPQQRHHWRELREERKAYWKSSHRF